MCFDELPYLLIIVIVVEAVLNKAETDLGFVNPGQLFFCSCIFFCMIFMSLEVRINPQWVILFEEKSQLCFSICTRVPVIFAPSCSENQSIFLSGPCNMADMNAQACTRSCSYHHHPHFLSALRLLWRACLRRWQQLASLEQLRRAEIDESLFLDQVQDLG